MKSNEKLDQLSIKIREARTSQQITQKQLADKCGIPVYRITSAENNLGNVPISVIRTIIEKGLGGQFQITLDV